MTMRAEDWLFQACVLDAAAGRGHAPLVDLLRRDHPITAADKLLLADFIDGKLKRGRGRPKEPLFGPTWKLRRAVEEVRDYQRRFSLKRAEALEWVLLGAKFRGENLDGRRSEILQELSRSQTKGQAKDRTK